MREERDRERALGERIFGGGGGRERVRDVWEREDKDKRQ